MATDPPLIQVAHLPSAASFYGSLTQPLGLQFLSATPVSPACLHFGYIQQGPSGPRKVTVFTVSQAAHPRLSHITLSAPSPKAVYDFYGKSLLLKQDRGRGENTFDQEEDEDRALTRDFDGNMIEAVYSTRASRGAGPRGTPAIEPAGLDKDSRRVLEWQQDVARSISGSQAPGSQAGSQVGQREEQAGPGTFRRADTFPSDFGRDRPMRLVRRETVTTEHYSQAERERQEAASGGISGKAVLGTLLGAAAGAAFAYVITRSEDPPSTTSVRRSSAPQYTHEPIRMEDRERVVETRTIPARSYVSDRARERDVQPRYVQYTVAAPPARIAAKPELAMIEERSHVSTRSRHSSGKEKEGSEVSKRYERPLTILPAPSRNRSPASHVSRRSKKSGSGSATGSSVEREKRRKKSPRDREGESEYMSARSHHSTSTIKPAVPQPPSSRVGSSSTVRIVPQPPDARAAESDRKSKSYVSERDRDGGRDRDRDRERRSSVSARQVPLPTSTVVSARQIPLPRSVVSGVGGGGAGYAASVAPSDSVSSVGSKRERERLRERMHVRGPAGGVMWGHG
ncbi:hypothetical protein ONS95_014285 [Cadophora gregata]|uniref:uncharacterized protein n=1 Tax=Cadophora gregata TaxID=51156 RepID=UPI0026DC1A12|nr:uncharacterized protein ONS95_014285 [Cadophora gregata]KAK0114804.1 hypothetical protein ONS95_014285 [Cadophora gregata]